MLDQLTKTDAKSINHNGLQEELCFYLAERSTQYDIKREIILQSM